MAKLLVHESSGVREFELLDAEVHIGRELDNTLRLPDPSISRHHCVLRKVGNGYEIQDLQSSNGVLLNGSRVQSSPLRDGDRVTLGQIQMTYSSPADEQGATVAMQIPVASSSNPLGTVRMSPEQMAAIHAGGTPASPEKQTTGPNPVVPTEAAPVPVAPIALAPVAPPAPPMPPAPLPSMAPAPIAPGPNDPGTAPGFGHFTNHGVGGGAHNPLPEFLQPYLPPVPDDARPIGERGDFLTRFLALLIDAVAGFICYLPIMVLMFIPVVNCMVALLLPLFGLGFLAFQLWCLVTFKATIGKKIMKLRVVREDDPTANIDWSMAILRLVGHFVNGMLLDLPYLMILGAERKGLQDIFSKSIVIKVDR